MKIYIGEIAGKDSVASIHKFLSENNGIVVIPTIVKTGTEYGDFDSYYRSIEYLKKFAFKNNNKLESPVVLNEEKLWNMICVKYQYYIYKKFAFYTPCISCHLFAHLIRVPVVMEYKANGIISGERHSHNGLIKANQHRLTLKHFIKLFERYDIELIQPLMHISDTNRIEKEIADYLNIDTVNDVKCVLSGNLDGRIFNDNDMVLRLEQFLKEYIIVIGDYVLSQYIQSKQVEYNILQSLIERTLFGG